MAKKITKEQDLSSPVERINRGGLKIKEAKPKKPKGTWGRSDKRGGGKKEHPGNPGSGRPSKYNGERMSIMLYTTVSLGNT